MTEGVPSIQSAFSRAELSWLANQWVWAPSEVPLPVNTRVAQVFDRDGVNARLVEKLNSAGDVVGAVWVYRGLEARLAFTNLREAVADLNNVQDLRIGNVSDAVAQAA